MTLSYTANVSQIGLLVLQGTVSVHKAGVVGDTLLHFVAILSLYNSAKKLPKSVQDQQSHS